jgi:predicted nucleotidyltransferase
VTAQVRLEISSIADRIGEICSGAQVYLFGSYARGEENADSDLDICVICESISGRRIDLMHTIRRAIYKLTDKPLDIVVYERDDFTRNAMNRSRLEYSIQHEGVPINV